jgi:hypothetical protein
LARISRVLALLIAAGVIAAAFVELNQRSDDDGDVALEPTIIPSPSSGPAEETFTPPPVETEDPEPSKTEAPADTPERSVSAPRTPTPEPDGTMGPIAIGGSKTPHTGGSSAPAGLALLVVALALRALILHRRPSY